jgi:hypothetical protein
MAPSHRDAFEAYETIGELPELSREAFTRNNRIADKRTSAIAQPECRIAPVQAGARMLRS